MKNTSERRTETEKSIRKAFLEFREGHMLSSIKVADVCRRAEVSRKTFYNYYCDVYDLNDQYEDELLETCLKGFQAQGLIYTDPIRFFNEFNTCLLPAKREFVLLGRGRELEQLKKMESWLVKLGQREKNEEEELFLTMLVAGSVSLWERYLTAAEDRKHLTGLEALEIIKEMLAKWEGLKPQGTARKKEFSFADMIRYRNLTKTTDGSWMYYLLG